MEQVWILFNENWEVIKCFKDKDAAIHYSCIYFEDEELTFEEYSSYIDIYDENSCIGFIEPVEVWEEPSK